MHAASLCRSPQGTVLKYTYTVYILQRFAVLRFVKVPSHLALQLATSLQQTYTVHVSLRGKDPIQYDPTVNDQTTGGP